MLYCNGEAGDDWLDNQHGCQQADADAFCKLKLCDEDAFASTFEVTPATNNPGFVGGFVGLKNGDWFGMTGVRFEEDIKRDHGSGDVVSDVTCQTRGKSNYYVYRKLDIFDAIVLSV